MLLFEIPVETSWEYIMHRGVPVVVYGMGNGADKVIDELIKLGVNIAGVTASDDFVRGQHFRGYQVKKLSEFDGDFIIAIAFGSSLPEVIEHIVSLTEKYDVIVPVVPVVGNEIFNRQYVEVNEDKINEAYCLFNGRSKTVFENCIKFMLSGRLEFLMEATDDKNEIFTDFLKLSQDERYLDIGAYRGDTVKEFLSYSGGVYNGIIALEPDERNYKKLKEAFDCDKNINSICKAVSDHVGYELFSQKSGRQSRIDGEGIKKECTTIDRLCTDAGITYVKIDVEGAERKAIIGGKFTIEKYKPKLNVALYHRSCDIFDIPLLIKSINTEYSFELRKHPYIPCWDLNLYCK